MIGKVRYVLLLFTPALASSQDFADDVSYAVQLQLVFCIQEDLSFVILGHSKLLSLLVIILIEGLGDAPLFRIGMG